MPDRYDTELVHIVRRDFISDNQIVFHRLHLYVVERRSRWYVTATQISFAIKLGAAYARVEGVTYG